MTEKALGKLAVEAEQRWPLLKLEVLHRIDLGAGIKRFGLHPNSHGQPPVTGGKNATSSPATSRSWS